MSNVHICAPRGEPFATVIYCPTCGRQRRMFGRTYEWHGTTITCAGCGDIWTDGDMHERPFCPSWRRKNIEKARAELAKLGVLA